ncbi:MAG: hypothetical protein CMJ58_27960 [Planctomycetaceae bacterium]|nr:hypothetical protein [Planctomycetaceae bacterium]
MQLHNNPSGRLALSICLLVAIVAASGCSDGLPHRVPVSGVVKIDGKPLDRGSIMIVPADDRPAGGSIGPDGRFTLTSYELNDGVVTGTHQVAVQSNIHIDERTTKWLTPKKYGDPKTSGLTVTIEEPTDDLVIELTWDGKEPFTERL